MRYLILFGFLGLLLRPGFCSAQTFSSGTRQVPLIELYTSEGCSSCPPADRWLTSMHHEDELWSGFVPIALHVDYWDYIGWEDPFASSAFSQRQRQYAREYDEPTVYTPGVRKNGREWRNWRSFIHTEAGLRNQVGPLTVTVDNAGGFSAKFDSTTEGLYFNIAVLGINLSSKVVRGENKGKTLKHDFVVLGLSSHSAAAHGVWSGVLPPRSHDAPEYAIAAWVSEGTHLAPIQATGGFLGQAPD